MSKLFKYILDFAALARPYTGSQYNDVPLFFRRSDGDAYAGHCFSALLLQPPVHSHEYGAV